MGTGSLEAAKYIGDRIRSLTLRIIWMPALDIEDSFDLLPTVDQSTRSSWQITETPAQRYSQVIVLRLLIQAGIEYESSDLSKLIELNTRGL